MTKIIATVSLFALCALGMACGETPANNAKPANTSNTVAANTMANAANTAVNTMANAANTAANTMANAANAVANSAKTAANAANAAKPANTTAPAPTATKKP